MGAVRKAVGLKANVAAAVDQLVIAVQDLAACIATFLI